jgi:hypothetical protein
MSGKPLFKDGTDQAMAELDGLDTAYAEAEQTVSRMRNLGAYDKNVHTIVKTSMQAAENITVKYACDGISEAAEKRLRKFQGLDAELKELEEKSKKPSF